MHPASGCPDAETLAAFADGRIPKSERAALIAHVDTCDDCTAALEVANETLSMKEARIPQRWWLAAAAALIVALVGLGVWRERAQTTPMDRLVRLVPQTARPSEARLSGGFAWAAYQGPMRADEADADPQRMQLIGAAGEIVAEADRDRSSDAQQAAGVALVVTDRPLQAVARLQSAVQASSNDAEAWSDLAAAQYATANRLARPSLLPEALVSSDRALRIDPRLAEARFNRALILERLGLSQEARKAWERYLEVDPSSEWAVEARQRLAKIAPVPAESLFRRDLPRIEKAADAGDAKTLDALLAPHAQHTRAFAEAETLGQWAEAFEQKRETDATRSLRIARTIGDALQKRGESLLHDAVQAIDAATPAQRTLLAAAHASYRRGRIAYSRQKLDVAREELARAAQSFERGGSPMQNVARYYAANVRFDQNEVAHAAQALDTLLLDADAHPQYVAFGAQVRWERALCFMVDGDWSGALPLLEKCRDGFGRLGENNHHGFIESLLADTLLSLGRPDEAWAARINGFALLSTDDRGDRLAVSMKSAAQMELRNGRLESGRALLDLERSSNRAVADAFVATDALIRATLINTRIGDTAAASTTLREAAAAEERITDPSLRELAHAHVQLATAATLVPSDDQRASDLLDRAIALYDSTGRGVFLPECYLLRARAAEKRGDRIASADDLERGIALLERSRAQSHPIAGMDVLDAGEALFDDAIRLCLDRGDHAAAFSYAERSRTRVRRDDVVTVPELQQRLGNSNAAVLQLIALPDELVAMCVTALELGMKRYPMSSDEIADLVAHGADPKTMARWYELAIRPFDSMLAKTNQLIVIADRPIDAVPFAAAYDSATRRYLVERMAVSRAGSASELRVLPSVERDPEGESRQKSRPDRPGPSLTLGMSPGPLLAVVLPSGDANAGLPETSREIVDITPLYRSASTIEQRAATFAAFTSAAPRAGIIHIAGHTQRQPGDAGSALVFARERVTWSAIAAHPLPRAPIVVLAACETLLQRTSSPRARSMTLGDGFLAAGASDVIGTLTPIADAEARALFRTIHVQLAAGATPAEAVRRAQLEALSRNSGAWRAVTSLTRTIRTQST
jgi:tetratricopeptide (TPR) repeat protein